MPPSTKFNPLNRIKNRKVMTPEIFAGLKPPKSQLYFDLQALIAANGGRLRLVHELELEWQNKYMRQKHITNAYPSWTIEETEWLVKNYPFKRVPEIAKFIKRSRIAIYYKISQLVNHGIMERNNDYSYRKFGIVLNFETGIFYDTINSAARVTNMPLSTFRNSIVGVRKNKTNFKLV